MPITKGQDFQDVQDSTLPVLGFIPRSGTDSIFSGIDIEFDAPLRLYASPTPDAFLHFSAAQILAANGSSKVIAPVNGTVTDFTTASSINFQTKATTGPFSITFPTAVTGQFYRVLFSLDTSGTIVATFSPGAVTENSLVSLSSLMTPGIMPLGWVDLVATSTTAWKTAGSTSSVIENAWIFRFTSPSTDNSSVARQNTNAILVNGGSWSWDNSSSILAWTAIAYVSTPGLADSVNSIPSGSVILLDGQIAYVEINRVSPGGNLTVLVGSESSVTSDDATIVLARRSGSIVLLRNHVGFSSTSTRSLGQALSDQNKTFIGITDESSSSPAWKTNLSAPLRNIPSDSSPITNAVASIDTELNKTFGQLKLTVNSVNQTRANLTGVAFAMLDTTTLTQTIDSLLLKFTGAQIDFATGSIYANDGVTLVNSFTPVTIGNGLYRWYSVTLTATNTNADNSINGQVSIVAGLSDGSTPALAPKPQFGAGNPIGFIAVLGTSGGIANLSTPNILQIAATASGSGAGAVVTTATLYDTVETSTSSGAASISPFVVDGVTVVTGTTVLFANLLTGNNQTYRATVTGSAITWTGGNSPTAGHLVIVTQGNVFANQLGEFNGTSWIFQVATFFTGVTLADNSTGNIFSVPFASNPNIIVNYSVLRSGNKEAGTIFLTTDGTNVGITVRGSVTAPTGVTFSAVLVGYNLILKYTTTSTGSTGALSYTYKAWSDTPGGPGVINQATLVDNTSNGTLFSIPYAGAQNVKVDFSILRSGVKELGVMFLTTNGTTVGISSDGTSTGDIGTLFSATVSSGNIVLQYTTSNTGSNAAMIYSYKTWSDNPGVPTSYAGLTAPPVLAGVDKNIQFNNAGIFGASPNFNYDIVNDILLLGNKQLSTLLTTPVVDNQLTPIALVSMPAIYNSVFVEYTVIRGTNIRTGLIKIATDGSVGISNSENYTESGSTGITLSVVLNSGNINILYTTSATGAGGTFKYALARW